MGERPTPMEEVPPLPPPAGLPRAMDPPSETHAMMLAAVHSCGHEEPLEVSRTEFESTVRDGSHVEDTLEDLPTSGRRHQPRTGPDEMVFQRVRECRELR